MLDEDTQEIVVWMGEEIQFFTSASDEEPVLSVRNVTEEPMTLHLVK